MDTKADFEVLSQKSTDMDTQTDIPEDNHTKELDVESEEETSSSDNFEYNKFSENTGFFHELYKDNRELLEKIAEKERRIAQLEERNEFLVNSNVFWICGTVCSMMTGFFSLLKQ